MTPDQLLTFACVADTGNISRAAQTLHLSQPAVSGQLRMLQEWFGEPLYRRSGHGIALTEAGERLAEQARQLRQVYRQAQAVRESWRGLETGVLRLGASTTPASYLLPRLVAEFRQAFPAVSLHCRMATRAKSSSGCPFWTWLSSRATCPLDCRQTRPCMPGARMKWWRSCAPTMRCRAGRRDPARPGRVAAGHARTGFGVRRLVERAFADAGLTPSVGLELAGVEGVKQAVRAGLGVGFVSVMSMRHEDGALAALRLLPRPLTRTLSILVPHADAAARAAGRFLAMCMALGPADGA